MRSQIGKFQLELFREGQSEPAVLGTDAIGWVDGRWTEARARDYVASFAREYCDQRASRGGDTLEWRGSVYLLDGRYRSMVV